MLLTVSCGTPSDTLNGLHVKRLNYPKNVMDILISILPGINFRASKILFLKKLIFVY